MLLNDPVPIDLLYPLTDLYGPAGMPLPEVTQIRGSEIPLPYRDLLVHNRDMTGTLERACGARLHLRMLHVAVREDAYFRVVLLEPNGRSAPVEFGAIKIQLERFAEHARELILEHQQPLGAILNSEAIRYNSRPSAYLRVIPDDYICRALELATPSPLFGRRNTLTDDRERILADIVEILPPAHRIVTGGTTP